MEVSSATAEAGPRGGEIRLDWTNPTGAGFGGVRVLRREGSYPELEDLDNPALAHELIHDQPAAQSPAAARVRLLDTGLKPETVYYYSLVAYDTVGKNSPPQRVSAMTTAPYQTAQHLYEKLPGVYRNYDTALPPDVPGLSAADRTRGQLRRFIDMFGLQFDLLRSYAGGVRNNFSAERIDGRLLPLLADWLGWPHDASLPHSKQRNEIGYAPHFFRTTGVVPNLRATINRLVTWDAQIKEFVHNVQMSNMPEGLSLWGLRREGANPWQGPEGVSIDVAYEGRPCVLGADAARQVMFYHARRHEPRPAPPGTPAHVLRVRSAGETHWHLWVKTLDQDVWGGSRPLTLAGSLHKYPSAAPDADGKFWLAWADYDAAGRPSAPQLRLAPVSVGRGARPARLKSTNTAPFAFNDGDEFDISVHPAAPTFARRVVFRNEHFRNIAAATAAETAALLDSEIPGVDVTPDEDGSVVFTARSAGTDAFFTFAAGAAATALGVAGTATGTDGVRAQLTGNVNQNFALEDGDSLTIQMDGRVRKVVTFRQADFGNIASASAAEVAAVINRVLPGVADMAASRLRLRSTSDGDDSLLMVEARSPAGRKLGFGAPPPNAVPGVAETEPSLFREGNNLWLFWSARRDGRWKIWYSRYSIQTSTWGAPKVLTDGPEADREPAALLSPAGGGRVWVFWSRKKANGLWNVFYRSTTNLNFDTLADGDWTPAAELTPVPPDYDNRDPHAVAAAGDAVTLFYASNRAEGWHVWEKELTPAAQGADARVTTGQFTHRAPAASPPVGATRLLFVRSNRSREYQSSFYPASVTVDNRHSGSLTADFRNPLRIRQRGNFPDVHRYTYDTGKGESDWYARDTVGIFLKPDTADQALVFRRRQQVVSVLRRFLPIQVRAVFALDEVITDYFYTYDDPAAAEPYLLRDEMFDSILGEVFAWADAHLGDRADYHWLRMWDAANAAATLPDLSDPNPDLSNRLPQTGVEEAD